MAGRIYEQIEESADLYEPQVYQLLSFYHALQLEQDPCSGAFIPMTTVQGRSAKDVKIFAVGLIPPSAGVTGRLLNRAGTIAATHGADDQYGPSDASAQEISAARVEEVPAAITEGASLIQVSAGPEQSIDLPTEAVARRSAGLLAELHPSIQPLAAKLIQLAAQQGYSLVLCEGYRSYEYQDQLYAKGRTSPGAVVTGTRGGESWHNFGLAFDVAMVAPGPDPKKGQPSWPKNRDVWQVIGNLGKSIGLGWGGDFTKIADYGHFEFHPGITIANAREGKRPTEPSPAPKPVVSTAPPATSWKDDGAANLSVAVKALDEKANKKPELSDLGKTYIEAQLRLIQQLQQALQQIAETPPLRLLVNPRSFRVSAEQLVADGSWGRSGPITEHSTLAQDKIEGSGKIAAFYCIDPADANSPGLGRTSRQFSASYQNLMSLYLIYKNNGGVFLPDTIAGGDPRNKVLSLVGSVYLYYDDILYIGSFDSFSVNESEESPFSLEYSFSFTVRSWFLLDHQDDPSFTYRSSGVMTPALPVTSSNSGAGGYPVALPES